MNDQNPVVQAWEDAGRPHPFATFRDGYEAAARGTDAKPINVRVVAEVIEINGEKWLEWALEGGIAELELGDELVWADRSITGERGKGIVYAAPAPKVMLADAANLQLTECGLCHNMRTLDPGEGHAAASAEPVPDYVLGRLYIGKATSGDQMLAWAALHSSQNREDAERYRALRDAAANSDDAFIDAMTAYGEKHFLDFSKPTPAEFDAAIDAARAATERKEVES